MRRVTNADVEQHIERTMGNVAAIARSLGVSRGTVWNRIQSSPLLQKMLADARETMLDNAESSLYNQVLAGEGWAVCFFLKTQGKSRGYIERAEVTGKDGEPLIDVRSDLERKLARISAGSETPLLLGELE